MKPLADFIRDITPEWTDEERFVVLSRIHTILEPACILGFVLWNNVIVRLLILFIQVLTVTTQLALRECVITLVEREFFEKPCHDMFAQLFHGMGWDITRSEKMTFNIGLNIGVLIVFSLMLLKESLLWMVGLAGVTVTALPTLAWFSTVLRSRDTAEWPLPNIHPV